MANLSMFFVTRDGPGFPVFYGIDDDAKYYPFKGSTHDDLLPDLSERPGFEREPDSDAIIGPGAS
jgi:hypothetical protein